MTDYICCGDRSNRPLLHHRICEQCIRSCGCLSYKTWVLARVKEETKDKSKWDEETKKRESLLRGLIKVKIASEVKKVRKVRRAK